VSPEELKSIFQVEPPPPLHRRVAAYRLFYLFMAVTLAADQASKIWIQHRLPFGAYGAPYHIPVIPGFLNIVHVGNTGAAWSMLSGHSVLLASVAALTLVAIYVWRRALSLRERLVQIAFGLLCGGIAGNLIDRIRVQHVVDFIDVHFGSYIYPTFNVADSGICIGVALYLWHTFRTAKRQ
jgi:signal peptidase II